MKAKHVIIYLLLVIVTSSCIRDEAPNAEADILSCRLPGITMTTSPIINNNSVTLFVTPGTNISALAPEFTLTSGATITPASGTERNFNSPQEYQVTAADGIWKKTYAISVIDTELATIYNFEDTISGKKYYIFVERENDKVIMEWASGNAGYAMTGVAKTADDYPTFQIANGKNGKCLSLVTRSAGEIVFVSRGIRSICLLWHEEQSHYCSLAKLCEVSFRYGVSSILSVLENCR